MNSSPDTEIVRWGEWQRVHPLSPLLNGGIFFMGVLGYLILQTLRRFYDSLTEDTSEQRTGKGGDGLRDEIIAGYVLDNVMTAGGLSILALGVLAGWAWLSWYHTRFRVYQGQLESRRGWASREHRQVPLRRVQAVEITRPLLAQLSGLAKVVVRPAGASDSQLEFAYLRVGHAEQLRRDLLALARHHDERAPQDAVSATDLAHDSMPAQARANEGDHKSQGGQAAYESTLDEGREVLSVPNQRLLIATFLNGGSVALIAATVIGVPAAVAIFGRDLADLPTAFFALPALVPLIGGFALNRIRYVLKFGNFTLRATDSAVRIKLGVSTVRHTTIPLHRVQAIKLRQPLWWRRPGWWKVEVNVAGLGSWIGADSSNPETAVLPVGTLEQALLIVTLLDPAVREDDLRSAASVSGEAGGWTLVSPRARIFDWWSVKRAGVKVTSHLFMSRSGALARVVTMMPHARVQSITMARGPWDRRRALATLTLVSTPGPVTVEAKHLDDAFAEQLRGEQAERAQMARALRSDRLPERPTSLSTCAAGLDDAVAPEDPVPPPPESPPRTTTPKRGSTTVNTPAAPPPADPGSGGRDAVERLGFAKEQIVQEFGYDADVDDAFRFAVEDVVGGELEDEDYTGETDAVILWWRDDDGDLTDALVDVVGVLEDGGFAVVLTPREDGAVDPSELDEAAETAGLHIAGTFTPALAWRAVKLVTPKR